MVVGARGFGDRICLRAGLGVVALAILAVGCTTSGASDGGGAPSAPGEAVASGSAPAVTDEPESPTSDAPTDGDTPIPAVWVLSTPPGFEDVMPAALTGEWAEIVTGSGCVLSGRAGTQTDAVDEMRAASVERLQQIAAEAAASLDETTDIDLTTQGAGAGNEPHHVLTLVTADWFAALPGSGICCHTTGHWSAGGWT